MFRTLITCTLPQEKGTKLYLAEVVPLSFTPLTCIFHLQAWISYSIPLKINEGTF